MSNQMRGLDFDLGEAADMLRDAVESFAADEIAPRAAAIDAANEFPADLWPKLGAVGLLGVTVAPEYGGAGMGYLEHVVAMEEVSRASAAVGLSYGASALWRCPSPAQGRMSCRCGCAPTSAATAMF
jgi:isovaleryl-CoA dehydrogenase